MLNATKRPQRKGLLLSTILIFFASYLMSLVLWMQVKDRYSQGVIYVASHLVTIIKEIEFVEMSEQGRDVIQVTFKPQRHNVSGLIRIPVRTSLYTFNAPLTFGIMAALYPFIRRRKRAFCEALAILFVIHLLTVFSYEAAQVTLVFAKKGFDAVNKVCIAAYLFLWQFIENMVTKFEPFLIGLYLYFRFNK